MAVVLQHVVVQLDVKILFGLLRVSLHVMRMGDENT
jgi:hypothetical protein